MTISNSELSDIFRMMAPASLFGLQKNSLGSATLLGNTANRSNFVEDVVKTVFSPGGNGTLSVGELFDRLNLQTGFEDDRSDDAKSIASTLRAYGIVSGQDQKFTPGGISWHTKGIDYSRPDAGLTPFKFNQIVPTSSQLLQDGIKNFPGAAIILSDSAFIHPSRFETEKAELFMNSIPTIVMNRCVPYLSAEFVFDGKSFSADLSKFARPGLLRFLMGGANNAETEAEKILLRSSQVVDDNPRNPTTNTVMGMEAFTSPQTLVNSSPSANKGRTVDVQDPFRPLATIENFTVNVQSTLRFMSIKRASMTLKLHDRSRMNELADFVRPATYPRTTVWITYGWRHPVEPGNPYADFINGNMLIREAYGVKNASYSFDDAGQVQITLELFTRGSSELLDLKFNELTDLFRRMQASVDTINQIKRDLRLDSPEGISKNIKASQILDAGSRGTLPNLSGGVIRKQISDLERILKNGYDQKKANDLIKSLRDLYDPNRQTESGNQSFLNQFKSNSSAAFSVFANHWSSGPDPFLMTQDQNNARINETGKSNATAIVPLIEGFNRFQTRSGKLGKFNQKVASLGKVMSSILVSSVIQSNAADELYIYYYSVNKRAGLASGINLAEFPIELDRFRQDLSNHITANRTDRISVSTLLSILSDSQIEDIRAPAYGLREYFEPYDPKKPSGPRLKKKTIRNSRGQSFETQGALIRAKNGPIQKPVIDMYVETSYLTSGGGSGDLLAAFRLAETNTLTSATVAGDRLKRVMKIHIYDKTFDPNPAATAVLSAQDDDESLRFRKSLATLKENKAGIINDNTTLIQILNEIGLTAGEDYDLDQGAVIKIIGGNDGIGTRTVNDIKNLVSQTVPTLIIGGSASNVKSAQLASKTDDLTSIIMIKGASAGKGSPMAPPGGAQGGLPLRIFPATLNLTSAGNPLFRYSQIWFIDFNTGTTADALYNLTGLTHTLAPGQFETTCTFSFADGYGKFQDPSSIIEQLGLVEVPTNDDI